MVVPSGGAGGVDGGGGDGDGGGPVGSGSGSRVKGSWTPEEDDLLRRAVTRHGARNWTVISAEIPGRSGKSCRLRWCNQLSPGVERRAFTPDEDAVIVAAHAQYGNKWATIARMLRGRTDNSVKNHWNSTLRRRRRAAAANANAAGVGCAFPLRPLAAAVATAPLPLCHLLDLKESAASESVPFQPLDPKGVDDEEDMDEEDDDEDDGSSEDSVLMPPPKKRPCAGHLHPSLAVKPEHAGPTPPPPAEPLTSLTLSLPGGGDGESTPAPLTTAASVEGAVNMRAKLEKDPWFVPIMRQMICEEVQRQMQGMDVSCSAVLAAPPAGRSSAGGADDGRAAASNGQD